MEGFQGKRKSTAASISLFTTLSESFSLEKPPAKSARNFSRGGGVGLGIVAAMTESRGSVEGLGSVDGGFSLSPRSKPIPILSSAKAAANFRGGLKLDCDYGGDEVDESSESYTCVISHRGDKSVRKRVYFDGKLDGVSEDCVAAENTVVAGVFSASPASVGELEWESWKTDFLSSCLLCKKQLLGLDIFMYRGEKAFCSWDCRDKHIRSEDYKEKCRRSEVMKPLDFSVSPCTSPQVFLEGVAAA